MVVRACDGCAVEKARWYCPADLAYLCERCDGSIHSANSLARRHARFRLGPNGMPLKRSRTVTALICQEGAATESPLLSGHLANSPRKRPRSIRRQKPRSLIPVSKHGLSSMKASNYINRSSEYFSATSIHAPNQSIMIDNPRNGLDLCFKDSTIDVSSKFVVKGEPLSPIFVGDQVKVPEQVDDCHPLLESLFDFEDTMQADDLFLHQVPILYNPLHQNQDHMQPSTVDRKPYLAASEESKPAAAFFTAQADLDSDGPSLAGDGDYHNCDGLARVKCDFDDDSQLTDSGNDLCDLNQRDFDRMLLEQLEEDVDQESNASDMHVDSDEFIDVSSSCCHVIATDESGSFVNQERRARYGIGMDDINETEVSSSEADHDINGETINFHAFTGPESPRSRLCKVIKVESPSELISGDIYLDHALGRIKELNAGYGFKLGLKLNFENVLHEWSDRGPFWMEGKPPRDHELTSCLEFLGERLVPADHMGSTASTEESDGQQPEQVLTGAAIKRGDGTAREARVLRYREKRRTRLFSKKIRYEVRKLNAEKRPRMKGRFVKRISIEA